MLFGFFAGARPAFNQRYLNLVPFKNILFLLGRIATNVSYKYYENLAGNILLFIPVPFILAGLFNMHRVKQILLCGLLLSFTIELVQFIFERVWQI